MPKTLPISDVKTRLPELVKAVAEREEEVIVTRNGRPAAVLINYTEYERLRETIDLMSDPALLRQIRASRRFFRGRRRGLSLEDVFEGFPPRGEKSRRSR